MAEGSFQEKTEKATPRKREESRKKGQVARSVDVNSAAMLLAGTLTLFFLSAGLLNSLLRIFQSSFGHVDPTAVTQNAVVPLLIRTVLQMLTLLGPLLIVLVIVGLLANVGQFGFLVTFEPLVPKPEKLNPLSGLKNLVSVKSLGELVKGVLKLAIVGLVSYLTLRGRMQQVLESADYGAGAILLLMSKSAFALAISGGLAIAALGVADFFFQRWQFERSLRMTKEEVREEHKQTEGDPQVKARIRSLQREVARKRMMSKVPEADVVITNPVHLAVALKYDPDEMSAPVVIAKGARKLAERIKEIAQEHSIPIVEDKPLARLLYRSAEVGEEIPIDAYRAVAEILGYIYRLTGRVR